jgi:hypothetical protein
MATIDTRTTILWWLLLASALLLVPVIVTLPLALLWRSEARGTVYSSHFRAIVLYCWIILLLPLLLLPLLLLVIPSHALAIAVMGLAMLVLACAAIAGLRSVSLGNRYRSLLA